MKLLLKKPRPYITPNNKIKHTVTLFNIMIVEIGISLLWHEPLYRYRLPGISDIMVLYYPHQKRLVFDYNFVRVVNNLDSATEKKLSNIFSSIHNLTIEETKWYHN